MPLYEFWCECGATRGVVRPMGKQPSSLDCEVCGEGMFRSYGINVSVFEPYTTKDFTGEPIRVTSPEHRDALCKEHGVTYDKYDYTTPNKLPSAVDGLEYEKVKQKLNEHSDEDLERVRREADDERGSDPFGGDVEEATIPVE